MKFIDLTKGPAPKLKPVKLTHCLQATGNLDNTRTMSAGGPYDLNEGWTYTRVATLTQSTGMSSWMGRDSFDVIKVTRPNGNDLLFFGQWNDGVAP